MKFSQLVKGIRARKPFEVVLGDQSVTVDLRILSPLEEERVLELARARAKSKGVEDPHDGNPIYDLAKAAYTLLSGVVDHQTPADAPEQFFATVEELLGDETITVDHIAQLHEQWEAYREEVSPRKTVVDEAEWVRTVVAAGGGDLVPFTEKPSDTRTACFALLANRYLTLLGSKYGSTWLSSLRSHFPTETSSSGTSGTSEPPAADSTTTTNEPTTPSSSEPTATSSSKDSEP